MGLKPGLIASIYRLQDMPEDLKGWKSWARKLDRQWRQYEEKQRLSKATKPATSGGNSSKDEPKKTHSKEPTFLETNVATRRDATGVTFEGHGQPMDLNEARRKGLCFNCGKQGHIGRNCPAKMKVNVRQMVAEFDKDQIDELKKA